MWVYWLRYRQRLRRGHCEHGYELTGSINGWKYREKNAVGWNTVGTYW
jgi:hypothetical protein